jgi:hypothetical protein
LLNTLEEDLCKECTRPTLRRSVERQPIEGQSSTRSVQGENLFQVRKLRRTSKKCVQEGTRKSFERRRRVESLGRLRKFEKLRRDSAKSAQESDLFQVPKIREKQCKFAHRVQVCTRVRSNSIEKISGGKTPSRPNTLVLTGGSSKEKPLKCLKSSKSGKKVKDQEEERQLSSDLLQGGDLDHRISRPDTQKSAQEENRSHH